MPQLLLGCVHFLDSSLCLRLTGIPQPIVLGIYTRFYIPLQEALRPATKAMILALLPGLEEEAGEFFEKVQAYRLRCMFAY